MPLLLRQMAFANRDVAPSGDIGILDAQLGHVPAVLPSLTSVHVGGRATTSANWTRRSLRCSSQTPPIPRWRLKALLPVIC